MKKKKEKIYTPPEAKLNNLQILVLHFVAFLGIAFIFWTNQLSSFGDNFQHLARMFILLNYDNLPYLQKYYYLDFQITPYLGMDIFFYIFHPYFTVYETGKLLAIFYAATTISGVLFINYRVFGRLTAYTLLAYPFLFSYPFGSGLVNFTMSIGFILWGFGLWLMLEKRPLPRFVIFFLYSILIYFIHLFGLAIMLLFIGVYELQKNNFAILKSPRQIAITGASLLSFVLLPLYWLAHTQPQDMETAGKLTQFDIGERLLTFFSPIYYNISYPNFIYYLTYLSLIMLGVLRFHKNGKMLLILSIIALLVPKWIYQIAFVDVRIPTVIALLSIALVEYSSVWEKKNARFIFYGFVIASLASIILNYLFANDCKGKITELRQIIKTIPPGSKLLSVKLRMFAVAPSCAIGSSFDQVSSLGTIENQIFISHLYTGLPPVRIKEEYADISARIGGPITLEELNLKGDSLKKYQENLVNERYAKYMSQKIYWKNWRQDFDYINLMHFGDYDYTMPKEAELISEGSFFSIYKIRKASNLRVDQQMPAQKLPKKPV